MIKKKICIFIQVVCILFGLAGCRISSNSSSNEGKASFSIEFIDVGQGDSALVECDGRFMLIDGGSKKEKKSSIVSEVLKEKKVTQIDILALSHLHEDHIGGLIDGLCDVTDIKEIISNSNSEYGETQIYNNLVNFLDEKYGKKINVPPVGKEYNLGEAKIKVLDVSAVYQNDSLVLLVTFKDTKYLFTGDILEQGQIRLLENCSKDDYDIDVIKMPHHGDCANLETLRDLIEKFKPEYAIISVGENNQYSHPSEVTVELLNKKKIKLYRTDFNGNITVSSDGEKITVKTSNKY